MLTIKLQEPMLHILRSESNLTVIKDFEHIINHIRENFHERINLSACVNQRREDAVDGIKLFEWFINLCKEQKA